jgi:hypothetical protein
LHEVYQYSTRNRYSINDAQENAPKSTEEKTKGELTWAKVSKSRKSEDITTTGIKYAKDIVIGRDSAGRARYRRRNRVLDGPTASRYEKATGYRSSKESRGVQMSANIIFTCKNQECQNYDETICAGCLQKIYVRKQ